MPAFDPTILLLVGVALLFYFMLVRPQRKRAKQQQQLMDGLKPGDRVMTIAGIVGTIRYLGEKQVILEVSPGVEMTLVKAAISFQPVEDEFEYAEDGSVEQVADDKADPVAEAATDATAEEEPEAPAASDESK